MRRSQSDGTGAVLVVLAFLILIVWALIKAAIDWLTAHPLVAACIPLTVAGVIALVLIDKRKQRAAAERLQQTARQLYEAQMTTARDIVAQHAVELSVRRKQLTHALNYGLTDDSQWQAEIQFFIQNKIESHIGDVLASPDRLARVSLMITEVTALHAASRVAFSIDMNPTLYEHLVADALTDLGWNARITKGSGDQGVDVIAEISGRRVVIQCKRYSRPIGNTAVQEAIAGMTFERADRAAVVSNAGFTRSARQLAASAGVLLLHHDELATLWPRISPRTPAALESLST